MNYSLPGSSVHGILQARILELVAIPSQPRDQTWLSRIAGRFFAIWTIREAPLYILKTTTTTTTEYVTEMMNTIIVAGNNICSQIHKLIKHRNHYLKHTFLCLLFMYKVYQNLCVILIRCTLLIIAMVSSVQSLNCVWLSVTPWTAAHQASLSITNSQSFPNSCPLSPMSDANQPSHSLSFPSPPAFNLSQHQGLFQWVMSSHQVAKVLEFQLQHQSFQWTPRTDLL